jgi:hypothetical protein
MGMGITISIGKFDRNRLAISIATINQATQYYTRECKQTQIAAKRKICISICAVSDVEENNKSPDKICSGNCVLGIQ